MWRRLPLWAKAWIVVQLALAQGLPLVVIGAIVNVHVVLASGVVLVALFVLDTAIVYPFIRARRAR